MNIEAEKFKLEMSYGDLWSTAFDVRRSLEHDLKTHWVNHQDNWKHNESGRLDRIQCMFLALGRPDLYQEIFVIAKDVFSDFNQKKI